MVSRSLATSGLKVALAPVSVMSLFQWTLNTEAAGMLTSNSPASDNGSETVTLAEILRCPPNTTVVPTDVAPSAAALLMSSTPAFTLVVPA